MEFSTTTNTVEKLLVGFWLILSKGLCCAFALVNQGRLAQHNAAPFFRDAAFAGETDHNFQQRSVWDSLRQFFTDHPGWK
jgi:hypothetical protein